MWQHPNGDIEQAWARKLGRPVNGGVGSFAPDYASQIVGSPTMPYGSGSQPIERTRTRAFYSLIFENWLPFTWRIVSRFIGPRAPTQAWQSPYDVDASERITRFGGWPQADHIYPYPYVIGAVSGFCALQDEASLTWSWGKTPNGPSVGTPIPIAWQTSYPNLPKVTG